MKEKIDTVPMMLQTPSNEATAQQLRETQRMFHRSLAAWASDVLLLRKANLHQFAWRSDDGMTFNSAHTHAA